MFFPARPHLGAKTVFLASIRGTNLFHEIYGRVTQNSDAAARRASYVKALKKQGAAATTRRTRCLATLVQGCQRLRDHERLAVQGRCPEHFPRPLRRLRHELRSNCSSVQFATASFTCCPKRYGNHSMNFVKSFPVPSLLRLLSYAAQRLHLRKRGTLAPRGY